MDDLRAEPSTDHPTPEMNPTLRKSDRALETRELPPSYAVPIGNTSSLVRTCQDCKKQYEVVWFWGVREMRKQGEPKSNSCLQCKAVVSVLQHTGRMSGIETYRNKFQEVLLHKAEDYIADWRTRVSQHEAYTVPNDLSLSEVRQKLITYIAEHVQSYFANHSQVQKRQSISASRQRVQDLTEPIDEHVTSLPQKRRHNQVVLDSASLSPARLATKRRREDVASEERVEKKDQQEAMTEAASGDHVTLTEWTATWQQFESVCDGSKVRAFLRDFGAVMAMKKGLIEALKEQIQDEAAHKERVRRRKLTLLQNDASSF